ncbi:hypothetical protein [Leptospira noguchii]|nr:hypothetical protein [Leptospira noguchii]
MWELTLQQEFFFVKSRFYMQLSLITFLKGKKGLSFAATAL